MFQLILGISLGIILLFVLLLLITEVAATYPVWKQFDKREPSLHDSPPQRNDKRNYMAIWLLVLVVLLIICLIAYFISTEVTKQKQPEEKTEATAAPKKGYTKLLSGSDAGHFAFFRLQTKWQDGRMYGNNTITFHKDTVLQFSDCRYHLLDGDGFLVREISFSPEDFVYTSGPSGTVNGLSSKFNTEMELQDYRKIEKLQVVLDKKIVMP